MKFAPLPGMQFSWLWPDSAQPEALISPFILGFIFLLLGIPHTFHHQLWPLLPYIFSSEQSLKSSLCCSQFSRSPIAFGGPSISSCFCPGLCAFSILYIFFENSNPSWIPEHFWASPKSPSTNFLSKVLDHGMQLLFNFFFACWWPCAWRSVFREKFCVCKFLASETQTIIFTVVFNSFLNAISGLTYTNKWCGFS